MNNRIVYTYKEHEYYSYRNALKQQGKKLCGISEFLCESDIERLNEQYDNYVIDVSTLSSILEVNESLVFQFEQVMFKYSQDVMFVIEEKHAEKFLYFLRNCFEKQEQLIIDSPQETTTKATESLLNHNKVKKIIDLTEDELEKLFVNFDIRLYGHNQFKDDFRNLVYTFRVFNKIGEHKVLSLFLMGDSGVGKTEVARVLHKCLASSKKLAKISFGNYSSKDALNSLIGSPLGYIGSDGGELIKRLSESDIGLILIDEFEKADIPVFNYFLDILENGKATNTRAEEYDVDGYIIVFTSNISKEQFEKNISPELRSRFDYKGVFDSLTEEDKNKFMHFRINEIISKYNEKSGQVFDNNLRSQLYKDIDVSKYKNMRDLNKKIKDAFVKYVRIDEF